MTSRFPTRAVYPRVCGGTLGLVRIRHGNAGLSPRVRGNPSSSLSTAPLAGSIPACAGEPAAGSRSPAAYGVYPRVCGGTLLIEQYQRQMEGLSPRVRGNRAGAGAEATAAGSIPACAGEPGVLNRGRLPPARGVYPRVCGGTRAKAQLYGVLHGLSPRVRGNPPCRLAAATPAGSIPACAGEPEPSGNYTRCDAVYPRVCGGTRSALVVVIMLSGLSPRVRGNPP